MKVPATLQRLREDGQLECKGVGECYLYATQPKTAGNGESYVSINMGEFRIHLDSKEFRKFCEHFLYNRDVDGLLKLPSRRDDGIVKL